MIACRLSASIKSSVLPVSGFAGVEGRRVNSMIFLEFVLIYFFLKDYRRIVGASITDLGACLPVWGRHVLSKQKRWSLSKTCAPIGIGFMKLLSSSTFRLGLIVLKCRPSYRMTEMTTTVYVAIYYSVDTREPCHWALWLERSDGQSVILQVEDDKNGRGYYVEDPPKSPCAQRSWPSH